MKKSELIQKVAEQHNLPKTKVENIVNTIFNSMKDAILAGERIEIRGFGSFTIRTYNGYTGRNPRTGEPVTVEPKKLPYFKVGKELRELVNTKK
ncbi:MAG: integration host factor subunit beta [Deltaproteobacteria bacterium]|nr:integration host factor subunit beta [Deltaproteobacteria bacterium]